jgi:hypothetical protein
VRLRWIREDSIHLTEPLPAPTLPADTLARLKACPPGLTPPIPARAQVWQTRFIRFYIYLFIYLISILRNANERGFGRQILVDMKNASDLLSSTEGLLQGCEKAFTALENDLSQRLSQITPASSRQATQMAQLQAYLDTIRKRRQNTASLHDKVPAPAIHTKFFVVVWNVHLLIYFMNSERNW